MCFGYSLLQQPHRWLRPMQLRIFFLALRDGTCEFSIYQSVWSTDAPGKLYDFFLAWCVVIFISSIMTYMFLCSKKIFYWYLVLIWPCLGIWVNNVQRPWTPCYLYHPKAWVYPDFSFGLKTTKNLAFCFCPESRMVPFNMTLFTTLRPDIASKKRLRDTSIWLIWFITLILRWCHSIVWRDL